MNNWKAVGCIFLVFGLLCFVVGLIAGNAAANANPYIASIDPSASQALFMNAFEPYAIISLFMFAIGAVGLYAGRTSQVVSTTDPTFEMNTPNTAVSNKSTILCGSCRTVNDIDAVYCKKCGKQFRQEDVSISYKLT